MHDNPQWCALQAELLAEFGSHWIDGVCAFFCDAAEQYALKLERSPTDVFYLATRFDNPSDAIDQMHAVAESSNHDEALMGLLESGVIFQ